MNGAHSGHFNAIDLNTGEPPLSINQGVLLQTPTNQIGQGYVIYSFETGVRRAFRDADHQRRTNFLTTMNPSIPRVVSNIVDSLPPTSLVAAVAREHACDQFRWSVGPARMIPTVSGIQNFDVYFSDNGGSLVLWQNGATNSSGLFTGSPGHAYGFFKPCP